MELRNQMQLLCIEMYFVRTNPKKFDTIKHSTTKIIQRACKKLTLLKINVNLYSSFERFSNITMNG